MEWYEYPAGVQSKFNEYFKTLHLKLDWMMVLSKFFRKDEIRKVHGAAYTLCPFHKEITPSVRFSFSIGIFLCYGCGCGGDMFAFIKRMEGGSFQAMLFIRKYFQIPLPFTRKEWRAIKREIDKRRLDNINLYLQEVSIDDIEKTFESIDVRWELLKLKKRRRDDM